VGKGPLPASGAQPAYPLQCRESNLKTEGFESENGAQKTGSPMAATHAPQAARASATGRSAQDEPPSGLLQRRPCYMPQIAARRSKGASGERHVSTTGGPARAAARVGRADGDGMNEVEGQVAAGALRRPGAKALGPGSMQPIIVPKAARPRKWGGGRPPASRHGAARRSLGRGGSATGASRRPAAGGGSGVALPHGGHVARTDAMPSQSHVPSGWRARAVK
jgi:hypothetical protein